MDSVEGVREIARQEVGKAILAVSRSIDEPTDIPVEQLRAVHEALVEMRVYLEGSPQQQHSDWRWVSQLVADQWDPRWSTTELVIHATELSMTPGLADGRR